MSGYQLPADPPFRGGGPLRAPRGGRAAQRAKIGHVDAVEETRHTAARDELQAVRSAPLRGKTLHRTGRQKKAWLKSRQPDIGRVDVAQGIVGLPVSIEGHAALAERDHASLTLLRRAEVGTAGARGSVERPRAVAL